MSSQTIRQLRQKIEKGESTLFETIQSIAEVINRKNPELNAFTSVNLDEALKSAAKVDEKIKNGSAGKLAGCVIGIKEAIVEKDKVCNAGSKMLENFESVYASTVVERLLNEDAIIIGRTNMDEFAMGSSTENSAYAVVRNPINKNMVPGGSSGGSAAAVAAGMCNATLGSDTGGSIRQPAAFCGVVGLKPTYGRVSRYGLIAYASSFDSIGPITTNVEDAALITEVIAGEDPKDGTSSNEPVESYSQKTDLSLQGLKIGVPKEYFGEGLDPEISNRIKKVLEKMRAEGAELVDIKMPMLEYAIATYYILATAEASSNLARYDGIRYGHRADIKKVKEELSAEKKLLEQSGGDTASLDSALNRLYKKSRTEGFGTEVKRRIMLGTYVLSAGYYDAYYGKAQKMRRLIQDDFLEAFKHVDVIASPTSPSTAFEIGSKTEDPLQMYLSDIYTISANLAGIPAISVPVGNHSNGLPIGMQFSAPHFKESTLFGIGKAVEKLEF